MKKILAILLGLIYCNVVICQEQTINVLFVLDASSSMYSKWGSKEKWKIAEQSLVQIADSLTKEHSNLNFGLRVYGHQSLPNKNDCLDTELKLPIGRHPVVKLKNTLTGIKPKGITPLAYTLEQTDSDFHDFEGQRNILILITDGSESCEGDPCAILDILMKREIIVKPVIIGLDIDVESLKDYHCINEVYNPHSAVEFQKNIIQVIRQSIYYSSLQVNLLDENNKPTQTNIPMFFYSDKESPDYKFYHKFNKENVSDTLFIEPKDNYNLVLQTLPPIYHNNIHLKSNQHNVINIPAATCNFSINTYVNNEKSSLNKEIPYFIKQSEVDTFFYSLNSNQAQDYLYGTYDIDLLTLPITQFKNVQFNTPIKEIKIEAPGKLILNADFAVHGSIFGEINKELINIYNFKANSKQEILDLQPGKYHIVYRFNHKDKMVETITKIIEIKAKENLKIKL